MLPRCCLKQILLNSCPFTCILWGSLPSPRRTFHYCSCQPWLRQTERLPRPPLSAPLLPRGALLRERVGVFIQPCVRQRGEQKERKSQAGKSDIERLKVAFLKRNKFCLCGNLDLTRTLLNTKKTHQTICINKMF